MSKIFLGRENVPIFGWCSNVEIEEKAHEQLKNTAKMPFIFKHLAVMPDVHWGMGSTVGSVIPTKNAIIPAAVGVDIGCGMMAVKLNLTANDLPENLKSLRLEIEAAVPHGKTSYNNRDDYGGWRDLISMPISAIWSFSLEPTFKKICEKYPKLESKNHVNHLGTLGTGNHFIEICLDENEDVWVMLHSGSRGIGNAIGRTFIELAKKECAQWMVPLPDSDLAYFPKDHLLFDDYWQALCWSQEYAAVNREIMMRNVLGIIRQNIKNVDVDINVVDAAINCHHNYAAFENHFGENVLITRKGAIRARKGELGIIPGSMGARSFIVRGKGNADSFNSCSHGAGRVMSRTQAKKIISLSEHEEATKGVECKKDISTLDESPAAYKNIDDVMESQKDLVEIVHTLKQVLCIKG